MTRTFRYLFSFIRSVFSRRSERYRSIEDELDRRSYSFRRLVDLIGYTPSNEDLFLEALLHRSFLPIAGNGWESNERLEFLGDAVLNMIVADHLFRHLPDQEEGHLTKVRARLVNRRILAETARSLDLHSLLLMSSSASQSLEQGAESILADGYEAIIGAIFSDAGFGRAKEFIDRTLLFHTNIQEVLRTEDNHKSALLEFAQRHGKGMPRYDVVREQGPEHDRAFVVEVRVDEERLGTGRGKSKKAAEQAAASRALEYLHKRR